jgi:hypothetical protein
MRGSDAFRIILNSGERNKIAIERDCKLLGSDANSKVEWVRVMIWKKWADDEQVKRHEGSVCRAPFRP